MYKKWNREQAQITCAFNFIRPELHEWLYTLTLGNCIAASRRPQGITMELYRVEPSRLHIHLTVPKYTTHSALKQFITAKYKLLNPKLAELNKNTFNMSKRDLKIFKLGYFKKMSFPEIAEEILQEFPSTKLDSGLIKKIYYRASNKISQLFMGRPWQLQFEKNTKHTTPKKI